MTANLPREFLWTELNTMDEFFRLDPVNEAFFETFVMLREEPFGVTIDAVKVFNEVYFHITDFYFKQAMGYRYYYYISDIKANLGWNYSAELVISMAYWLTKLSPRNRTHAFKVPRYSELQDCDYWEPFRQCYEQLKKSYKRLKYDFKPRPVSPDSLRNKYFNWADLTDYYDVGAIRFILDQWDDIADKKEVAAMIKDRMDKGRVIRIKGTDNAEAIRLLNSYVGEDVSTMRVESSPNEEALQGRIRELEAEVGRLNTLMEGKKQSGKDRKFTLVQMVDYCKGCVDWNDVKSIVAMLNKLLRRIGTDEDSELVDSIEAEFINRKYGDTVMGDKNEFNGNSAHNTITLPRGITPQEALRLLQNKKKEDGEEG